MDNKICPLLLAAQHPNGSCLGSRCAWCYTSWDYMKKCEEAHCAVLKVGMELSKLDGLRAIADVLYEG